MAKRRPRSKPGPSPAFPGRRQVHQITLTDEVSRAAIRQAEAEGFGARLGPYIEKVLREHLLKLT